MSKTILIVVIILIMVGAGYWYYNKIFRSQEETLPPTASTVTIKNFSFNPAVITIKEGGEVIWRNDDSVPHRVLAQGIFDSGNLSTGETFSYKFNQVGPINYICSIHPSMTGQVVVEQ